MFYIKSTEEKNKIRNNNCIVLLLLLLKDTLMQTKETTKIKQCVVGQDNI